MAAPIRLDRLPSPVLTMAALAAVDLAMVTLVCLASFFAKLSADPSLPVDAYLRLLPGLLLFPAAYAAAGLYPGIGLAAAEDLRRTTWATSAVFASLAAATFLLRGAETWSRQIFLVAWAGSLFAVPLARSAMRRGCSGAAWWGIPVVVLGAGRTGTLVIDLLRSRPWMGLKPVAMLDDDPGKIGGAVRGLTVTGPVEAQLPGLAAAGVRHGILAMPGLPAERLTPLLDRLGDHLRHVHIAPALPGSPELIAEAREFAGTLVLEVRQNLLQPSARLAKRLLDLAGAAVFILLFCWLLAGLALAVRLSSRGPVFYGQVRVGRDRRPFRAWKFRSMVADADAILAGYLAAHPELQAEWDRDRKLKNDPRVTWIGRILRRTSLDELPQLWNVLRGEMSLVGPRPIVEDEVPRYGERFPLYAKVRPGMTGMWQVSGRSDTSYAERVAFDCYYVRTWSPWLDLVLMARTVRVVLAGKGAY
jgi:Undecaprenyl-phosphate galactose phosphotransferase WbaP